MFLERKQVKWCLQKIIGPCNRGKESVCAKKEEGVSIVKRKESRGTWVHWKTIEEGIYQTLNVTSNGTYILCRKEGC